MNRHQPEHEAWIEALALNERERIPDRLRESMTGCAECAARVANFEATRAELNATAAQMHADLAAAAQQAPRADERASVRRWAGVEARPVQRRAIAWLVPLAAMLAVFAAGYYFARPTTRTSRSEHLGSTRISDLRATVSAGVVRFEWSAQTLGDETQQVDLRYTDSSGEEQHFASDMLFESRWQIDTTRLAGAVGSWSWSVSLGSARQAGRERSEWLVEPLPGN